MPVTEAPVVELGSAPQTPSIAASSPSPSEISSASTPEPQNIRPTPLFRALAMPPPDPEQPPGQDELERRLPGYRRIVIPRDLTLIELLKQDSGLTTDEEVLCIREAKLRVVAERVGLRRLNVLAPRLRSLTLDGSALSSLRDLGIGLVHLKTLSVNRCGLTCLDGVWGLGALKELHAAGNRLQDLHPLAALQKLHTLNLSDNPIEEADRLWTLGVCGALRNLKLKGTPIFNLPDYRDLVASSLPMVTTLDDAPMYEDEDIIDDALHDGESSSESEEVPDSTVPEPCSLIDDPEQPGPSTSLPGLIIGDRSPEVQETPTKADNMSKLRNLRRRPATTEAAGFRPPKPNLPQRPRTALERPSIDATTRLQILNTLMDEEWRCSGSRLTSNGTVCGNLARALRRPSSARCKQKSDIETEMAEETIEDACQMLADEIPRVPWFEEWAKFRETTGIDIDIDFNKRTEGDPLTAIERLERIEKETSERFQNGNENTSSSQNTFTFSATLLNSPDMWKDINITSVPDSPQDLDSLFNAISITNRRLSDSN